MLGGEEGGWRKESGLVTIAGGLGGSEGGDNGLPGANVALEKAVHGVVFSRAWRISQVERRWAPVSWKGRFLTIC